MMDSMVGRMMKLRQRFGGMMDGVKGMFGGGDDDPEEGMDDFDDVARSGFELRRTCRTPRRPTSASS